MKGKCFKLKKYQRGSVSCFPSAVAAASGGTEPLSVTASNVSGGGSSFNQCGTHSASGTNTTPSGGSGSYSFSWAQGPGGPATRGPYGINSTTQQNPFWQNNVCDNDTQSSEQWTVTVTDTVTSDTATDVITVTLTHTNLN